MKFKKLPPFVWTSPMGRETPPWKIPHKINPDVKWFKALKFLTEFRLNKELTDYKFNLFPLWESRLIDKYEVVGTNMIAYKVTRRGAALVKKYDICL